jgi:hypothetical protein
MRSGNSLDYSLYIALYFRLVNKKKVTSSGHFFEKGGGYVTDACIAGRPVRFGLLSRGIAIARDMFAISRE